MSEEIARILLTDAAGGDGQPPPPTPAGLLARARIQQRRRDRGLILMAVVLAASLTASMVAIQLELTTPRKPIVSAPSAAPRVSQPAVDPSIPYVAAAASGVPQPTAPPWPADVPGTPHCGWNDALAPKIMSSLAVTGQWGNPAQVFGICDKSAATQIIVTEGGLAGMVSVVVSLWDDSTAKKMACDGTGGHCDKISGGYLHWDQFQDTRAGRSTPVYRATARLALDSGTFIDVSCSNDVYDRDGNFLSRPTMDHAPCTGVQAANLARELAKTNWLG
ncbi:hypothetical protein [Hamadaea tsunoensis]|uniref:hypothetical protein n=1 Tax=Hamadaea tsunoensis TaxID=53368 RepID=UPI0004134F02|nr:hypothetical protein [Hamadaea tsunoensis]